MKMQTALPTHADGRARLMDSQAFSRRQRGGTLLGLLIGVVLGLAIAVATAMFVTRASVPFIGGDQAKERLSMPSDKPPPPVSPE